MTKKINATICKINSIKKYQNLLEISLSPGQDDYLPGQFFMLGIPGWGEAPFTPTNIKNYKKIDFLIQKTGTLTSKFFNLEKKHSIMLRGPFGNPFPLEYMKNKNITLIAGGCGLAPIKSLLEYLIKYKKNYGHIQLFYGVNNEKEISYKKDLNNAKKDVEQIITVAKPSAKYHGNIGYIDKYINKNTIIKNTVAILCGPPAMYKSVIKKLISAGVTVDDIFVQLERKMHCGVGLCQHCTCGSKYVCKDGPAFSYREILKMDKLGDI